MAEIPELREAVCELLEHDSFPRAGRALRERPALLSEAADRVFDALAADARRCPAAAVEQLQRFVRRCRRSGLDAVFPSGRPEIDPQMVTIVAADMAEANRSEAVFDRSGDSMALSRAAAAWRRIVGEPRLTSAYPGLRAALLTNAGGVLLRRYWTLGEPADLDDALRLLAEAEELTPASSPARAHRLANLALAFRELHLRTGDAGALHRAVDVLRAAAGTPLARSGAAADVLTNLALTLRDRFVLAGDPDDLNEAIEHAERACRDATSVGPQVMLGDLLGLRHRTTGEPADLDRSAALLTDAVARTEAGSPERPRRLVDLSVALLDRHALRGDPADLVAAVRSCDEAVATMPTASPDRPACLAQRANALYRRYESAGRLDDLDQAVATLEQAIETAQPGEVAVAGWRVNLGAVLQRRVGRTADPADLDRAIELFETAVREGGIAEDRFAAVTNLGNASRDRARRTGSTADIDRAVEMLRTALTMTPEGSRQHASTLTNLGAALRDRFTITGSRADLDEALARLARAVEQTEAGDVDEPRRLFALAQAADDRTMLGSDEHVLLGIDAYRRGCAVGVVTDPESTLRAALDWAGWATTRRAWAEAASAYAAAIDAATALVARQIVREHQESWLRAAGGLPSAAAYAAVAADAPADAVVALERGRAAILAETLGRDRTDLDGLRQAAPSLAARYTAVIGRMQLAAAR